MYATPPWKPTAIELTTANRAYWWQVGDADERPERWTVRLDINDVNDVAPCPEDVRHVGVIELAVAELAEDAQLLNPAAAGSWAREFLAEAVTEPGSGVLIDELERLIAPGSCSYAACTWPTPGAGAGWRPRCCPRRCTGSPRWPAWRPAESARRTSPSWCPV